MNAPDDFDPPKWWTPPSLSYADMDAICREAHAEQMAEEYARDAMAGATSDPTNVDAAGTYTG